MSSAELVPIIKSYKNETSEPVWTVISLALRELRKFVETDETAEKKLREFTGNMARGQYERLGWTKQANETEEYSKLRGIVVGGTLYSEDQDAIDTARKLYDTTDLSDLDPDLRPLILSSVARYGDKSVIDQLLDTYSTTQSVDLLEDIAIGITSTRLSDQIDRLLAAMQDTGVVRPQDVTRWFVYLIRGRESREQAWTCIRNNWDWVTKTFAGDKSFDAFPRYAANALSSRQHLQEYIDFFEPKKNILSLTRVITLGIKEIEGRVDLIERDQAAVHRALLDI
jgi:aminopeptidase N